MNIKILVIGGTGMLGRPVAKKLQDDGFEVSVMSSNPERAKGSIGHKFNIIAGDVTDIQSLRKAFTNQDYVFINLASDHSPEGFRKIEIEGTANVARAAKELGIRKIGMISGSLSRGIEEGVPYLDAKVKAELALMDSGIPYLIMRPSWFFESLPWWELVPDMSIITQGRGSGPSLNVAMRSPARDRIVVYLADAASVTLDLGALASDSPARAAWIDPRSGTRQEIGTLDQNHAGTFSTPAGWEDALLLIERNAPD